MTPQQKVNELLAQISDIEEASRYFKVNLTDGSCSQERIKLLEQILDFEKMSDWSIYPEWGNEYE